MWGTRYECSMASLPEVFVSAASPELDAFRSVVRTTLRELGAKAVEHLDHTVAYGPLDGVLKVLIGNCDAVIHLVGFTFGLEPRDRTHGATRRSYSHYEYDVARAMGRRMFTFVARQGTATSPADRGDDEAQALQRDHRWACEHEEHWTFGSPEELAGHLRSLHARIMVRRRLALLPYARQDRALYGREKAVAALREAIAASPLVFVQPPERFSATSVAAGKTAVAVETAWRLFDEGVVDFALWLPGSSGPELESELALLTRMDALSLVKDEVGDISQRLRTLREWLQAPANDGRVLVVIDGVDTEAAWLAVRSKLPWFSRAKVVITTRMTLGDESDPRVSIGALSGDSSVSLLASLIFGGEANEAVHTSLETMARALGNQPLALQIAGKALAATRQTPEQFIRTLPATANERFADPSAAAKGKSVVFPVVDAVLAQLDPTARGLLQTLACLAPAPAVFPQALFNTRVDSTQTRAAVAALEKAHLLIGDDGDESWQMPRMIWEAVRDSLTSEQRLAALEQARGLIEGALQRLERSPLGVVVRARLVPHCRMLFSALQGLALERKIGPLARLMATWLRESGRLIEAEQFQRRALEIAERSAPPEHPDLIGDLRLLASILQDLRRFEAAAHAHARAIAILEAQPPARSGELVIELYGLAACLRGLHRLEEAEEVLRRALEVEEHSVGRNHPRTAIAAHVLATLLEIQHRTREAIPLYRRALDIDEHLPICPPARMASRMHHLAGALALGGDQTEAIQLHLRALDIDEKLHGADSPELIAPLKQLAALLEKAGRGAEALATLRRVLAIEEAGDSTGAFEMALTLTSMGDVLAAAEQPEEAAAQWSRALLLVEDQPAWHPNVRTLAAECRRRLHAPSAS